MLGYMERRKDPIVVKTESLKFIVGGYAVTRTVCFTFSRQFENGETAVAYYRLEIVQHFGAGSYSVVLRETDRAGNVVSRSGAFHEETWDTPESAITDVLTWCNNQVWPQGKWAVEEGGSARIKV